MCKKLILNQIHNCLATSTGFLFGTYLIFCFLSMIITSSVGVVTLCVMFYVQRFFSYHTRTRSSKYTVYIIRNLKVQSTKYLHLDFMILCNYHPDHLVTLFPLTTPN